MKQILNKLRDHQNLTENEMVCALNNILHESTPKEISGAFLMGLTTKGETAEEIAAAASYLRHHARTIKAPEGTVDCCGTGGDISGTYNISTAVALICAACGVPVAKHGNRAASSKSGAADVLEAMGVNIDVEPSKLETALKEFNFAFLMAPKHHQVLKPLAPIRKNLGIPTIFNLLGPLANPAGTKIQLIGVYHEKWLRPLAEALKILGTKKAWVVHGNDGLDEITLVTTTKVAELNEKGQIKEFTISPEDYGLSFCKEEDLKGGEASVNANALKKLMKGEKSAYRDIACLNAAAVMVQNGSCDTLRSGIEISQQALDSNKVFDNFNAYKEYVGMSS